MLHIFSRLPFKPLNHLCHMFNVCLCLSHTRLSSLLGLHYLSQLRVSLTNKPLGLAVFHVHNVIKLSVYHPLMTLILLVNDLNLSLQVVLMYACLLYLSVHPLNHDLQPIDPLPYLVPL